MQAAACDAAIGAHVSFADPEGFGRRALDTPPLELRDQVLWQASALDGLCVGAEQPPFPSNITREFPHSYLVLQGNTLIAF